MDTHKISNPTARAAFEAWQAKDTKAWLSFFTADAKLYDDGKPRDFKEFTSAIGKERFTSIDTVEDDGKAIYGQFHSDQWGDFRTFFKFTVNGQGRIERLDIGQA